MTADSGYISCRFAGSQEAITKLHELAQSADRINQYSYGLSWLDDLDINGSVESESISYDSISATQDFLGQLLSVVPGLQFRGTLEHSWPILPAKRTLIYFSAEDGVFLWEERETEPDCEYFVPCEFEEEDEDEVPLIPLTPYG